MVATRVGIIGLGFIGRSLYQRLDGGAIPGVDVAFVHDRQPERLAVVDQGNVLSSLPDVDRFPVDLIVECASREVTIEHGETLLRAADYMPLSLTALADDRLHERLVTVAETAGTRLLIAHGAVPGLEALRERREIWREVTITFRKPPEHIEGAPGGAGPHVLFDGTAREAAHRFPRNVNAMVACALATVGLDHCRAVLVADPALRDMVAEINAVGSDGSTLTIVKTQPGVGVSGTEMPDAILNSIAAAAATTERVQFV